MWTTIEMVFIALGLLLAFVGNRFSIPLLFSAGVVCLGLAMIATGWQAILTRHIVVGRRRYRGYGQTYTGIAAIFQGVQFNFIGLFLIGVAFMMYFNNGEEIFLQLARRPGLLLVLVGGLCLMQAVITLAGPRKTRQDSGVIWVMVLLLSRLLPGLILIVLGVGLSLLGLFETVAPERFDEMGGRLLEELYGVR